MTLKEAIYTIYAVRNRVILEAGSDWYKHDTSLGMRKKKVTLHSCIKIQDIPILVDGQTCMVPIQYSVNTGRSWTNGQRERGRREREERRTNGAMWQKRGVMTWKCSGGGVGAVTSTRRRQQHSREEEEKGKKKKVGYHRCKY